MTQKRRPLYTCLTHSYAAAATPPAAKLAAVHPAWLVRRSVAMLEHTATVTLYVHRVSGAELLSVVCSEEEKVFGAVFKTPVHDNTGTPHILEHSVLCGSVGFPVKEPFVQLMKSSLKTYLNAMAFSDSTIYPVASPNAEDFSHLVRVYLDAIFRPCQGPLVFAQEGWHYEILADGGLAYKGVVLNEMKGVYASPDAVRRYALDRALFSDSQCRFSSGGDPLAIPLLMPAVFAAYYRKHYAPRNAHLYFFGDDDQLQQLVIADQILTRAVSDRVETASLVAEAASIAEPLPVDGAAAPWPVDDFTVRPQRLWTAPRTVCEPYPCATPAPDKLNVTVNWVLHEAPFGEETRLALSVLYHLLLCT